MNITITTKRKTNCVNQVTSCFFDNSSLTVLSSLTKMRQAVNSLHQLDLSTWEGQTGCTVVSQNTDESRRSDNTGSSYDIAFFAERINSAVGPERILADIKSVTASNIVEKYTAKMSELVPAYSNGDYLIRVANITLHN